MTVPEGTPRDRLIEAGAKAIVDKRVHPERDYWVHSAAATLNAFLAHPADLLTEIAARGDLDGPYMQSEDIVWWKSWVRDAPTSEEAP